MNLRKISAVVACVLAMQAYSFSEAIKDFYKEIQGSPAWHGTISRKEAENLLQSRKPFTYLLRTGDESNRFIISYVQSDFSIKHTNFIFDTKNMKWFYDNEAYHFEEKVSSLIHQLMHCEPAVCKVL